MALSIHESGQGYWTRVLTAVMAGVLLFGAAVWVWEQVLLRTSTDSGADLVARAGIRSFRHAGAGGAVVEVERVRYESPFDSLSSAQALHLPVLGLTASVTSREPHPVVEPLVVQSLAAGVVVLAGAAGIYWIVGAWTRSARFLIAADNEMRKVNWSTPRDIRKSTLVVIVAAILLTACLFAIDLLFKTFFGLIGVLH
jgi:preprotein translocase SecE subunit